MQITITETVYDTNGNLLPNYKGAAKAEFSVQQGSRPPCSNTNFSLIYIYEKIPILLFIILLGCSYSNLTHSGVTRSLVKKNITTSYKVYKIDSINSFYLIYAKRNDSLYKIVSKKATIISCNKIEKDGEYDFNLHSRLSDRRIGNKEILPQNSLLVNCFSYDDSTTICLERDSINDLFYADNVKGLCFER